MIKKNNNSTAFQIPYRSMMQNTPDVIMEQFEAVEQSGKMKGRPSLYSQPLHIEVFEKQKHTHTIDVI